MELHTLPKTTTRGKKRLGQGHGSSRGKTAGRGTKGQNARGSRPLYFEGGAISLIKRLPFRRGKGRNNVFKKRQITINVKALNLLAKNAVVDLQHLIDKHLVRDDEAKKFGVKILGDGELSVALTVKLPTSKGATQKIEKAGGTVVH